MRSTDTAEHEDGEKGDPHDACEGLWAFEGGTFKILPRRRPVVQTVLPFSVVLVAFGLMLPFCLWIAAPRSGRLAATPLASIPTAAWVFCAGTVIMLVVHAWFVRYQRRHAIETADAKWRVRRDRKGMAEYVSLVFAYAGHTQGHIATVWPILDSLRARLAALRSEHRIGAIPCVWVIDPAPTRGLREFIASDRAVLPSLVSVGWYQFGASVIPIAVAVLFLVITSLAPALLNAPWPVNQWAILVGTGIGLAVGFVVKFLYLKFSWRLARVRGLTFLVRKRVFGGIKRRGPLEDFDPLWILSPIDVTPCNLAPFINLAPFMKRYSKHQADLYLSCDGFPIITTMIGEGDSGRDSSWFDLLNLLD